MKYQLSRKEDSNLHSSLVLRLHHLASMGHGTSPVAFTILLHREIWLRVGESNPCQFLMMESCDEIAV